MKQKFIVVIEGRSKQVVIIQTDSCKIMIGHARSSLMVLVKVVSALILAGTNVPGPEMVSSRCLGSPQPVVSATIWRVFAQSRSLCPKCVGPYKYQESV